MSTHDPNYWHPWNGDHHHGVDPAQYLPIFGEPLQDFLDNGYFLNPPWSTGTPAHPEEHTGYICLPADTTLTLPEKGKHPIKNALLFIHTTGDMHHFEKRYHSHYCFAQVGDGIVATGGHADAGNALLEYSDKILPLPDNPMGLPVEQSPYRAQTTRPAQNGVQFQFWSLQRPNPGWLSLFNPVPQNILGVGWETVDAPEYYDLNLQLRVGPGQNRVFQVFNIQLKNLPKARPFAGYTDRFGYVTDAPGAVGVDKVPLLITAGVPLGNASLFRRVGHGDPEFAPLLEF